VPRYVITSSTELVGAIEESCRQVGGTDMKTAQYAGQVFCTMNETASKAIAAKGFLIRPISRISTPKGTSKELFVAADGALTPVFSSAVLNSESEFYQARNSFTPPLLGKGWTVCVLDTGIRKTHRTLLDKVIYEVDLTDSGSVDDVFSHGTGVAFLIAGGRNEPGEESGMAPGAYLMNMKVLGDDGSGTTETVVLGIDECIAVRKFAKAQGYTPSHPLYPDAINISFGTTDPRDPLDPIGLAIKAAAKEGFIIFCASGNTGPGKGTIMYPASMPEVIAVGASLLTNGQVWDQSARGPNLDGVVKPDFVFFGIDIIVAGAKSDTDFEVKAGSSFAAPCVAGITGLLIEALQRQGVIGAEQELSGEDVIELLASSCRLPEPTDTKSNDFGFGQPFGATPAQLVATNDVAPVANMSATIATMGMVMKMITMMPKF